MLRTVGPMIALVLVTACGGPDLEKVCEETLACTEELAGEDVGFGDSFIDLCEDTFDSELESYEDDEVDALAEAIDECDSKSSCNFLTCVEANGGNLMDLTPDAPEPVCGDDWADPGEECDGSDLWGETCSTVSADPQSGGTLSCSADCTFDTTDCM